MNKNSGQSALDIFREINKTNELERKRKKRRGERERRKEKEVVGARFTFLQDPTHTQLTVIEFRP